MNRNNKGKKIKRGKLQNGKHQNGSDNVNANEHDNDNENDNENENENDNDNDYSNLNVAGRLRLAHDLYTQAVSFAKVARLGREIIIAEQLAEQCMQAMVLEDFKNLRIKARRLSHVAISKVAEVLRPIDPRQNKQQEKKHQEKKQKLAQKCDHKVMVAFSAWMRASKMLQQYVEMGVQNVKSDMVEAEREMKVLKRLMQKLTAKKNELQNALPPVVKLIVKKKYEDSSEESDSSEDDMSMYLQTPATDRKKNDLLGLTLSSEMARWNDSEMDLATTNDKNETTRVQWNMQGTVVPVPWRTEVLDPVLFAVKIKNRLRQKEKLNPTTPKRPEGAPNSLQSKSPRQKIRNVSVTTKSKNEKTQSTVKSEASNISILPQPIPSHMVNMHVLVCESNHASGKLIKYLLEGEARRTLQYSCVVDVVTGQYKKESIDPFVLQQQIAYGTESNCFTFVILDLGTVFTTGMTASQYNTLSAPRKTAWIKRMYNRKEKFIQTSKQHFKSDTTFFITVDEPSMNHLLLEMCNRGLVQGRIQKPYSAMGVRRLLKEHYSD